MNIAFDLDGTLITAKERQTSLLLAVAKVYDVNFDVDSLWHRKRSGASNLIALNQLGVDHLLASEIDAAWRYQIESSYWLSLDRLFPDVFDFIQDLKRCGATLHLITARKNKYLLNQQLVSLRLVDSFSTITGVSPFDAVNEKVRVLNEVSPIFFIGDSETDFNASVLANVEFLGVSTGQRSKEYLVSIGVNEIADSLGSHLPLLHRSLKNSKL
jgi:phosphoglycolate phosphatase-like HAD superfamily hydrolase